MVGIDKIQTLSQDTGSIIYFAMLFHIVVFVHFVGGVFIALGLSKSHCLLLMSNRTSLS